MRSSENNRVRLDQLLVERGISESRHKAGALVMAGLVLVDGTMIDKPGRRLTSDASIEIRKLPKYVSRGGLKLETALKHFKIEVRHKTILDIGASTGGFTDCLLQYGAARVIAIDVGYGQLHWKLRRDSRVQTMERTNVRSLTREQIPGPVEGAVIDVSFISLKLVLPVVSRLLSDHAFIVPLIKPQFEAGKARVGKGGVVRDARVHREIIQDLCGFIEDLSWRVHGHIPSPILGPKGNREFLVYADR